MKYVLGIAMLLASAYCWQLSNGHSEEAVNFIEKQQELGLPVPIWMILLGLGLLFIIWGLRSRKVQGGLAPVTIQQQAPSLSSKKKTVSNELYAGDDWREKVRSQVEAMDTPSGVSLHIDLIKNVPLGTIQANVSAWAQVAVGGHQLLATAQVSGGTKGSQWIAPRHK